MLPGKKLAILKKFFDFLIFSSLFIAVCAVVVVYQTYILFLEIPVNNYYLAFVFFSTVCSYNFHWMLTPGSVNQVCRSEWSGRHRNIHLYFFILGLLASVFFFFYLANDWPFLLIAAVLTFLYSAPKISFAPFQWLKKFSIGKTIFLASVWTYVTTILPFFLENKTVATGSLLYFSAQFFFMLTICIVFDYRDRQQDKEEGIRSMITYLTEKGINVFFFISILFSALSLFLLYKEGIELKYILILAVPLVMISILYKKTKRNFSDYLYYFVLDGLIMLSGILLWIMNRF